MNDPNIYELYKNSLDGFKTIGGGHQFVALCPFHDDSKQSFSGEHLNGLWNCKACGIKGNPYLFAKKMNLPNPHLYIVDDTYKTYKSSYTNDPYPQDRGVNTPLPPKDLDKMMEKFKNNLKDNMDKYPKDLWLNGFIDTCGIGLDDKGEWVWAYYDSNEKLICIKHHKGFQDGDGKCKWFNPYKIADMDKSKPLYICEGEPDDLTLLSDDKQAISVSIGCQSMPTKEMLEQIKDFKEIYVCYDNDKVGIECGEKVANLIKHRQNKVSIIQWDKSLPEKFDVFDAYSKDKLDFLNALTNAKEIKLKRKGFEVLSIDEFMSKDYPDTEPIIESFVYKNHISILGGDTGCQKSWVAKQMALSVATGVPLFDHFKVNPNRVILVQFENENTDMQKRFNMMLDYYNKNTQVKNWKDNFRYVPKEEGGLLFMDKWKIIDDTLDDEDFTGGLLIVDNLYTSTEREIQINHELTHLIREIDRIRQKYSLSIELIAHTNKVDANTKCLRVEDLQGGKTLCNQFGHLTMMGKSKTSQNIKIMKMLKSRSDANVLEGIPFKLKFKDGIFTKGGIVKKEAVHFQEVEKKWEVEVAKYLREQPITELCSVFSRDEFKANLPDEHKNIEEYQITRLINTLIGFSMMNRIKRDTYTLNTQEIDDWD